MIGQKTIGDVFVLLWQHRAGGVNQRAAGLYIASAVVHNGALDVRQCRKLLWILIADIRLLADDAKTGARHIAHQ